MAAALDASPAAGAFFDALAQFCRNTFLRWIDATKRHPEQRAVRIAEDDQASRGGQEAALIRGLDSVARYGVHDGGMRTSELAGQAGVNSETLRYYERRGLLDEPPRTPGGYRDYPDAAVALLQFIKRAQQLGFTLDEVEELLNLDGGGPDGCDAARALAEARKADLEARIADLQRMRDSLADLVATCDRPRADRSCPLLGAIATQPPHHLTRPARRHR